MKKLYLNFILILISIPIIGMGQGLTSSTLSGVVMDVNGEPTVGSLVIATHVPSNSKYGGRTSAKGTYYINGLRVGGPYKIKASGVGSKDDVREDVYVKLGSNIMNLKLGESKINLDEIVVTADAKNNRGKTGSETTIGEELIMSMPTLSRDINDFTRLTPEANLNSDDGSGISIGGQNNRYNALYIDGAIQNDVFGLADNGMNGGQATGVSPFSLDQFESFQVNVAPFDVRQGGFAGGAINAVSRSGTNDVEGSVYMLYRNQDMAGTTPNEETSDNREKLASFTAQTYGARIGLPLQKDKLFLFTNIEYTKNNTPLPFDFSNYSGSSSRSDINKLISKLQDDYNYNPGIYENQDADASNWKIAAKIDYNLNDNNKLSFRYTYNDAVNNNASFRTSSNNALRFSGGFQRQPNTTHSFVTEWNSLFKNNSSNNLVIGYTNVVDDRGSSSTPFPSVVINDGSGRIYFGTEPYSSVNLLKQKVYTLTDNYNILKDNHYFTIGTHNELYDIFNAFIPQALGDYDFNSLGDFLSNQAPSGFDQTYSLADGGSFLGDNTKAAADFRALQLGLYVQDEFSASDKLKLTLGLRADMPLYLTDPPTNDYLNNTVLPLVENAGYDLDGAKSGQMPSSSIHFSPRFGFNYDVKGDKNTIVRGGTGVFTSRIPFVWIGGLYTNTGTLLGNANTPSQFNPNPASNIPTSGSTSKADIDLISDNFKLPQFWKTNLALDKKLPLGLSSTAEVTFTKTLNDYTAYNYAQAPTGTAQFDKPYYGGSTFDPIVDDHLTVIKNTGIGYAWNTSLTVSKLVNEGLGFSVGYSYGTSRVLNDRTSSQNKSNWRYMEDKRGKNFLDESYSDFDMGHRFFGNVSYKKTWLDNFTSSVSLFFNGQSGRRFSWIAYGSRGITNYRSRAADLLYVPNDLAELNSIYTFTDGEKNDGTTYTTTEQAQDFMDFINSNDYLSSRKGKYTERNGDRLPFQFSIDMRLAQEFFIKTAKGKRQSFELTFDIFNLTNLINNSWGMKYFISNDQYSLLDVNGYTENTTFQFNDQYGKDYKSVDDRGINSSRWQGQVGLRYKF